MILFHLDVVQDISMSDFQKSSMILKKSSQSLPHTKIFVTAIDTFTLLFLSRIQHKINRMDMFAELKLQAYISYVFEIMYRHK